MSHRPHAVCVLLPLPEMPVFYGEEKGKKSGQSVKKRVIYPVLKVKNIHISRNGLKTGGK